MEVVIAVLTIIMINLVLSGDNAVVIGLASRRLPLDQRRKAILWGTFGAVALRILFAAVVTVVLQLPLLHAAGGAILLWIAYKLLVEERDHQVDEAANLWGAIRTIIVADAVMSLDNVIAIAGAARGHVLLLAFGVAVSIPIVIFASQILASWMERWPIIVYAGAGVLAWVAGGMLVEDPTVRDVFHRMIGETWGLLAAVIHLVAIAGVLGFGYRANRRAAQREEMAEDAV